MKQVMFLVEKNRRDMWVDSEDGVWFYDLVAGSWQVLVRSEGYGFELVKTRTKDDFKPTSQFGPYRRLWKTPR